MKPKQKEKLEALADQIVSELYYRKPSDGSHELTEFNEYKSIAMTCAQTILDNPGGWGLQEIPDYYCAEKDRVGYVCEEGPCERCEKAMQHDAVATRNEMLVDSEKEIIALQSEVSRLREALEHLYTCFKRDGVVAADFKLAKEALKQTK